MAAGPSAAPAVAQSADGWWAWEGRDQAPRGRTGEARRDGDREDRVVQVYGDRRDDRQDDDWERDRRDRGRWEWDDRRRRQKPRRDRHQKQRRGQGPAFCRNGRGHPVHGIAWCRQKGWSRSHGPRWQQRHVGDVVFGRRDRRVLRRRGTLGERVLRDVLGDIVFRRFERQRRRMRVVAPIEGRWFLPEGPRGPRVLQVRVGRVPLAELTDLDGDRRVDVALFTPMY